MNTKVRAIGAIMSLALLAEAPSCGQPIGEQPNIEVISPTPAVPESEDGDEFYFVELIVSAPHTDGVIRDVDWRLDGEENHEKFVGNWKKEGPGYPGDVVWVEVYQSKPGLVGCSIIVDQEVRDVETMTKAGLILCKTTV